MDEKDMLQPVVPPPAAPPPPPPPQPLTPNENVSSYQQADTRHASIPSITNYEDPSGSGTTAPARQSVLRGDANLNPNTGETNADSFIGTLSQSLFRLRIANILLSLLVVIHEAFAFLFKLLNPTKAVLGAYLGFFAGLLFLAEFLTILPLFLSSVTRAPTADLQDRFGFLFQPIGKGVFLVFLGSLCWAQQTSIYEFVLGILFFVDGFFTLYVFIHFPEYRKHWTTIPEHRETGSEAERASLVPRWADPSAKLVQDETSALLANALSNAIK